MTAYYNEFDKYAAQWLRNLIDAGHIAPGVVDDRSIEDVHPSDLDGFTQCHFFAGIGVWSYALRLAGWPDDRPVWTGSCPCQPFSAAGKGAGFDDERHLWPAWHHLIRERRPVSVFGEQVASGDGLNWLDLVHADMEAARYAFGAVDLCAAGVGAPHIRQRLFFVAHASGVRQFGGARSGATSGASRSARAAVREQRFRDEPLAGGRDAGLLGHAYDARLEGLGRGHQAAEWHRQGSVRPVAEAGESGGLADAYGRNASAEGIQRGGEHGQQPQDRGLVLGPNAAGPTNGFWRDADWLLCRDGRWRPVEPGTFPLAHGAPARVGRLRAFGNAINAEAAATFVRAAA